MSAEPAPAPASTRSGLPDYLSARMINEYVYCPRLFFFEQVEGVFVHNEHTVGGAVQHKRVDKEGRTAPGPEEEPGRAGRGALDHPVVRKASGHRQARPRGVRPRTGNPRRLQARPAHDGR